MEIIVRKTEVLVPVGVGEDGEPRFEWLPHLYATTDPDPDGRMFVQWLPLRRDATPGEHAMLSQLLRRNLEQRVKPWST